MAYSAPIFYSTVVLVINLVLFFVSIIVQVVALVHCLTQRGDGFAAIGTLPKGVWVGILAFCILMTVVLRGPLGFFALIGVAAALIYLLDVRPGLRDLSDGRGSW